MCAASDPDPGAPADLRSQKAAGLYDLFRVGSKMFENPTTRRTLRLAAASAKAIAGCAVVAVYLAAGAGVIRYSGRANHRLDLQVQAQDGRNGVLEKAHGWRYVLFFWGTGRLQGAFVLQCAAEPSSEQLLLLQTLAEPTGAASPQPNSSSANAARRLSFAGSATRRRPRTGRWPKRSSV